MKNFIKFFSAISFIIVFVFLIGCQQNDVHTDTTQESIQDYNKLFELKLLSAKQVYKTMDAIKLWATLEYIGNDDQVKIWHGDPYVSFHISDEKKLSIGGIINTIKTSSVLEKGKIHKVDYVKSGGYSTDDPNADIMKKFISEKDLYLPEGEYSIQVDGAFSLNENLESSHNNLSKKLKIKVEN